VDTVRTIAQQRHFYTAQIELAGYGLALVIGDQTAVERIRQLIAEDEAHDLIDVTDETNDGAA
jgi:hypothetical protein